MENLLTRYRNVSILVGVLFAQVLGLAVQVRRTSENESSRLIRIWAVSAITPLEKGIVWLQHGSSDVWRSYIYLRGVRQENRDLKKEIEQLRLEQVRLSEDAEQARRLQALLVFKEQFITKTAAAQVIGSSGSEQSRSVYVDKGSDDGISPDMAVITAGGVVGKVLRVFGGSSQVLLINDQSSGVGVILEKSRLQGVLRGTASGGTVLDRVMSDEPVEAGEVLRTSGGDQIFPKGLPVGTVNTVSRSPEGFLAVKVTPAVNLNKLEEVLIITGKEQRVPAVSDNQPLRAADILARRLPSVPEKPPETQAKPTPPKPTAETPASASETGAAATKSGPPPKPFTDAAARPQGGVPISGSATEASSAKALQPEPKPTAKTAPNPQGGTPTGASQAEATAAKKDLQPKSAQSLVKTSDETSKRPAPGVKSDPKPDSQPPSSAPPQGKPE
jgi:rod shape-determining protein MreC